MEWENDDGEYNLIELSDRNTKSYQKSPPHLKGHFFRHLGKIIPRVRRSEGQT